MSLHSVLSQPLLLWQGHTADVLKMIDQRPDFLLQESSEPQMLSDPEAMITFEAWRPYQIISGVAIVSVKGVLVHERCYWGWGETSYDKIAEAFFMAMVDPEVKAIALHINSPGGEVCGCFDLCDAIYSMRGVKPFHAIVDESAYSAAYAIACCADKIILPRTGGVGSIGVIGMHIDITGMLEKMGIKVTTIKFGDRKDDSQPTTELSKAAKAAMQADIDAMGEMFTDLVARNRDMDASKILKMEAACFLGEAGVEAGLADAVMSADQALMELIAIANPVEEPTIA